MLNSLSVQIKPTAALAKRVKLIPIYNAYRYILIVRQCPAVLITTAERSSALQRVYIYIYQHKSRQ